MDRKPGTSAAASSGAGGAGGHDVAGKRSLTEGLTQVGGGAPLPDDIKRKMEQRMRADFSKVRVHTDAHAEQRGAQLNAPAFTIGHNIFFRAGHSPRDEKILAHELVHVVQQGGAAPSGEAKLGGRNDVAEHEAERIADSVSAGEDAPAISTGHDASTVRRFGAGFEQDGHGSIEKDAAGSSGDSEGLKEMYSGNFMRDMNQLNVPTVVNHLQSLPKDVSNPKAGDIGGKGAIEITTAVIKAFAMLELGPKIANNLINKGAIGAYRPEEHIDNPMGTGAADTIVTNTDPNHKKADGKTPVQVGEPRSGDGTVPTKLADRAPETAFEKIKAGLGMPPQAEVVDPAKSGGDADRDRDLKGAAIPGSQVENPALYKVSPSGLANHIYNSNESVKGRWIRASQLGASPLGRSELGAGSHAVEDYFSHSNFVEVALNSYIEQALASSNKTNPTSRAFAEKVVANNKKDLGTATVGPQAYYVDTLYDAKVPGSDKPSAAKPRQAITTGSFGGDDTKVSIAHVLLPHMPKLQNALLTAVDQAFGIARTDGGATWAKIKTKLAGTPEGSAGATLLEGFDNAGMTAPVPDLTLKWKTFPVSPGIIGDPLTVSLPCGIDHIAQSVSITNAFATYAGIYKKAKDLIKLVNEYADAAKKLFIPLDWVIEAINAEVDKIEQEARKAIKAQVTAGLVSVVDSISGRSAEDKKKAKQGHGKTTSPDEEFKQDMGDALDYLHDSVESVEQKTSIESRLKNGDLSKMPKEKVEALVGPVRVVKVEVAGGKARTYYEPVDPLPPSHSEIAKDHGPHAEVDKHHDHDDPDHPGNEAGSPFFSLARPLAVEAVKHCDAQMQVVWAQKAAKAGGDGSMFGDGKQYAFQSSVGGDSKSIHDGVLADANANAAAEKQRAQEEGRSYAQTARAEELKAMPGVEQLLNLVDFFISHPDNNGWWKPIMDAEVAKNPEPIYQSILRRNATRSKRKKDVK